MADGRKPTGALPRLLPAVAVCALILPASALAAFPGTDPSESVRANTPNDPGFDHCEPDDADGPPTCSNAFGEENARFGFAPNSTQTTAVYGTTDPHTQRLMGQNTLAGRSALGQVSGVSADRAWKYSTGDPSVQVAILDTGIVWSQESLRKRIHLNAAELPTPKLANGSDCSSDDCNGDGAFNVEDFANDPRVSHTAGPNGSSAIDAQDLIATFSDGTDADNNGYVDDIAGWDFFDNDNDPFDASSYSSAHHHGSGRASDAAEQGNDSSGSIGVCPSCQIVPMRVWDTFVADTNNYGQAVTYAADNNIEIVEGAVGGLFNSSFVRHAFAYAYAHGTLPVLVSSDLNTADHNFPTDYNEALMVQGTVADMNGLGTDLPDPPACPMGAPPQCQQFHDAVLALKQNLLTAGIPTNAPVSTWFRNSGTTQYGGHAHIAMPATTGSEATGQASGAAGLLASYALQSGTTLAPNEIKQLLTMTAEDVKPQNTGTTGTPDPSQVGWDQHFGYGRPDLGLALQYICDQRPSAPGSCPGQRHIPPQARIISPDWFAPLNASRQSTVQVQGTISSRFPNYTWKLQWAPAYEPTEADFQDFASGDQTSGANVSGTLNLATVRAALDNRTAACPTPPPGGSPVLTGGSTCDATAPGKGPGDTDPNEPAFTVRLVVDVTGQQDPLVPANPLHGEDRKVLFDYRDTTLHSGWSRPIGGQQNDSGQATTGGEVSQRMYDLNGDNKLDIVEADSSGELRVLNGDGSPLQSFNNGQPVQTQTYANVHPGAPVYAQLQPPREVLRTPAIGDINGDMQPDIVDSAGEHVYAWNSDGTPLPGFPVRLDPDFSRPVDRTEQNHVKRGFSGSPTLADLNGDGKLDIVQSALDEHLYAWNGSGNAMPGFPVFLRDPSSPCSSALPCAESINTTAVGDITGDGKPEIIIPTNEFDANASAPGAPSNPNDLASILRGGVINVLANAIGGTGRVYAVYADGKNHPGDSDAFLPGWPITVGGAAPDALPFAGPGIDPAIGDVNGDGKGDAITDVTSGNLQANADNGSVETTFDPMPAGSSEVVDRGQDLGLFEYPVVADFDPNTPGLEVLKGGFTLNQLVNIGVATGQNLPYNHVLQAWNAQSLTGAELPNWPQAVEDFQLLSEPAVADVSSGSATGPEAILGTGLYLLRDINAQGIEGAGWPKFTGGWIFATPAIGDVDGDGKLNVSVVTREGFSFLWDTNQPACGTNDQWWTSHHDEFNSSDYTTDSRPPGTPTDLTSVAATGGVGLGWTAPGDDWLCGKAAKFRVIASNNPIQHPTDGFLVKEVDATAAGGSPESVPLTDAELNGARYVAVLYRDEAGNWGHLASLDLAAGNQGAAGSAGGGGGGSSGPCANLLRGTTGPDKLKGTGKGDHMLGRGGNDKINGRGGADCISGGPGNDKLDGGSGRDHIKGGPGGDTIRIAGAGRDSVNCGSGDDKVVISKGDKAKSCETVRRR